MGEITIRQPQASLPSKKSKSLHQVEKNAFNVGAKIWRTTGAIQAIW
jgi:hypothetical protein